MSKLNDAGQALYDSLIPDDDTATLSARSLALQAARIVDNLERIADELGKTDSLYSTNSRGDEIADPLLAEQRQQTLALRQLFITMGVGQLPQNAGGSTLFQLIQGELSEASGE